MQLPVVITDKCRAIFQSEPITIDQALNFFIPLGGYFVSFSLVHYRSGTFSWIVCLQPIVCQARDYRAARTRPSQPSEPFLAVGANGQRLQLRCADLRFGCVQLALMRRRLSRALCSARLVRRPGSQHVTRIAGIARVAGTASMLQWQVVSFARTRDAAVDHAAASPMAFNTPPQSVPQHPLR